MHPKAQATATNAARTNHRTPDGDIKVCFDDQQRQSEKNNLFLGFVFVPQMHRRCAAAASCSCSPALPLIHLEPQPHDPHNEEASDPDGDRPHFTCLCYAITFRSPCRRFETSAAPPDSRRFLPVRVSNRANALRARRSHQGEPPLSSTSSTFLSCDILK